MQYEDGTAVKIGHVVTVQSGPERYIIIGLGESNVVKLLQIGNIQKDDSPSLGEMIISPTGFTRKTPAADLTRVGSARINVVEEDPII